MTRVWTRWMIGLVIGLSLLVGAGRIDGGAIAQPLDCANAMTQLEINQCAAQEAAIADEQLNQAYQDLIVNLNPERVDLLRKAQRSWIRFRDRNCQFSSSRFAGGSFQPAAYSNCIERVTKQRTEELHGYGLSSEDGGLN